MYFPIWVDLKGQDSVPETVHHVVCICCGCGWVGVSIIVLLLLLGV